MQLLRLFFFFQAEDGIRDKLVTGVQTCALPIYTQRLVYAFRRCLSRKPTEPESAELLALLNKQKGRLAEGWLSPWDMAGYNPEQAPQQLPKGTTPAQLAAWTAVSRVLLNLDETITKE